MENRLRLQSAAGGGHGDRVTDQARPQWSAIDQPTTCRVQQSITVARYHQPAQVRM